MSERRQLPIARTVALPFREGGRAILTLEVYRDRNSGRETVAAIDIGPYRLSDWLARAIAQAARVRTVVYVEGGTVELPANVAGGTAETLDDYWTEEER